MKKIGWLIFLLSPGLLQAQSIDPKTQSEPNALVEERKDALNVTAYNPIYFIYNPDSTKVQASFKYQLHRKFNLYGAYTHLILWDWHGDSKPFFDQNYNPEIFYRWNFKNEWFQSLDLIPYGHISNGKDKEETRSVDYIGTQLNFKRPLKRSILLNYSLRLNYQYNLDKTNRDLLDYQGPVEFKFSLMGFSQWFIDKGEISGRIYPGGKYGNDFSKGGQEIGLNFRVLGVDIMPAFYLQYFHGYNESLKYYNQEESVIRFGVLL